MQVVINYDRKVAHVLEVNEAELSDAVRTFVFAYGLRQIVNDAGSAAKTVEEKIVFAEKKLAALVAGEVRRASAAEPLDPVEAEAERLAWDALKKLVKASGKKVADVGDEAKANAIAAYLEKNPEVRERAEEIVAAKRGVVTKGVDLSDFGL